MARLPRIVVLGQPLYDYLDHRRLNQPPHQLVIAQNLQRTRMQGVSFAIVKLDPSIA